MDIASIDSFLAINDKYNENTRFFSAKEAPFSVHGVYFDEKDGQYVRMPGEVSEKVSHGVFKLSKQTSGGRLRFRTDSPFIALRCIAPVFRPMSHMSILGMFGFSLYVDGRSFGRVMPTPDAVITPASEGIVFGGSCNIPAFAGEGMHDIEIFFPLYGGVKVLDVGLKEGAQTEEAVPYKYKKPIVFYGSSVTQGACASRPGCDFVNTLSRLLDADVLNLGFSGNGNAEAPMIEYLSGLDAAAFVFDYNYYASKPDRVLPPHLSIYEALREKNPNTPIIMIDKPGSDYDPIGYEKRSEFIKNTYETALSRGDTLVAMVDAYDLFGDENRDGCLVDNNHPNDFGFYKMAKNLEPVLKNLLEKCK